MNKIKVTFGTDRWRQTYECDWVKVDDKLRESEVTIKPKEVWAAEYTSFVCESDFTVISIHGTKTGALRAKVAHRKKVIAELRKDRRERLRRNKKAASVAAHLSWQRWRIKSYEVFK